MQSNRTKSVKQDKLLSQQCHNPKRKHIKNISKTKNVTQSQNKKKQTTRPTFPISQIKSLSKGNKVNTLYQIEEILGERVVMGIKQVLVSWKGYSKFSNRWIDSCGLVQQQKVEKNKKQRMIQKRQKKTKQQKEQKIHKDLMVGNKGIEKVQESSQETQIKQIDVKKCIFLNSEKVMIAEQKELNSNKNDGKLKNFNPQQFNGSKVEQKRQEYQILQPNLFCGVLMEENWNEEELKIVERFYRNVTTLSKPAASIPLHIEKIKISRQQPNAQKQTREDKQQNRRSKSEQIFEDACIVCD